jgi:hypothetical protein
MQGTPTTLIVLAQEPDASEYIRRVHASGLLRGIANMRDTHLLVPVNDAWTNFPDTLAQNPYKMNEVFTMNTRSIQTDPKTFQNLVIAKGPLTDSNVQIW